jgi:hypothetical protein
MTIFSGFRTLKVRKRIRNLRMGNYQGSPLCLLGDLYFEGKTITAWYNDINGEWQGRGT